MIMKNLNKKIFFEGILKADMAKVYRPKGESGSILEKFLSRGIREIYEFSMTRCEKLFTALT